jgi:hypothetical protein
MSSRAGGARGIRTDDDRRPAHEVWNGWHDVYVSQAKGWRSSRVCRGGGAVGVPASRRLEAVGAGAHPGRQPVTGDPGET